MSKIVFMGSSEFGIPTLRALHEKHDISTVFTREPKPAGRGLKLKRTPIDLEAERLGLRVITSSKLDTPEVKKEFDCDVAVVVSYGLILPQSILDAPKYGCYNTHASLLPRWRGAAPIEHALMAGDAVTGVTIIKMDDDLDTGDMIIAGWTEITEGMTSDALHDELAELGALLMVDTVDRLGNNFFTKQPTKGVTYAPKIGKRIKYAGKYK